MRLLEPSIKTISGAIWNHRITMTASVLAGLFLFIFAYLLVTPAYEASSSLLVGQSTSGELTDTRRTPELVTSQARIAESDEVIRAAINRVGLESLGIKPPANSIFSGLGGRLRIWMQGPSAISAAPTISPLDVAVLQVGSAVAVKTEPNSDIIKISFRHYDPVVAAAFANAVTSAFIDKQNRLLERPGAVNFFRIQTNRFNSEVEKSSAALEEFMTQRRTFSIEDQRTLLLKRASEFAALLANSRSTLAEKRGHKDTMVSQLRLLKPVTQSSYVSGLVDTLAGDERGGRPTQQGGDRAFAGEPPLLMVKVYQDAMVSLFKTNADIKGLEELATQQELEIKTINTELGSLATQQTEFERLKRNVALSTFNAELYAKRTVQEQIESDFRAAKLSNVRVIESASVPLRAVFPKGFQFAGLGLALGAIFGIAMSLFREMIKPEDGVSLSPSANARSVERLVPNPRHGRQI